MNNEHYSKIGPDGEALDKEASDWIAVRDDTTGLTWAVESIRVEDWSEDTEARIAVALEASRLAVWPGWLDGWRIPTRAELVTLIDDTQYGPAIDIRFFPDCPSDWFWTSTVYAPSPGDCAWSVNFNDGYANWILRRYSGFVRAVRASQ
jgi:hypothetical protein